MVFLDFFKTIMQSQSSIGRDKNTSLEDGDKIDIISGSSPLSCEPVDKDKPDDISTVNLINEVMNISSSNRIESNDNLVTEVILTKENCQNKVRLANLENKTLRAKNSALQESLKSSNLEKELLKEKLVEITALLGKANCNSQSINGSNIEVMSCKDDILRITNSTSKKNHFQSVKGHTI